MYTKILSLAKSHNCRAYGQMIFNALKNICPYLLIYALFPIFSKEAGNNYLFFTAIIFLYLVDFFFDKNYIIIWSSKALDKLSKDYIKAIYSKSKWGKQEFSLAKVLSNDINSLSKLSVFYEEIIPQFFEIFIIYLVMAIFLIKIYPQSILIVPCAFLLMSLVSSLVKKNQLRVNKRRDKRYLNMNQKFLDDLQGISTILMYGAGEKFQERFDKMAEKHRADIIFSLGLSLPRSAFRIFIANSAIILLSLILKQTRDSQSVLDLIFVTFLNMHIMGLSKKFSYANKQLKMLRPVLKRILAMVSYIDEGKDNIQEICKIESIEFNNVSFSYDDLRVFDNFNYKFEKGKLYGLVGENGSGKSTIIKLIKGQEANYKGKILVNGKNHNVLNQSKLASQIGVLEKESYIFDLSIKENLLIASKRFDDFDEIKSNLAKYGLLDFVDIMPLGFETPAGENGINLSNGQKQLLSLAMLVLQDKSVYILDEATSSVNPETNEIIMNFIKNLAKEKIVINISHRKTDIEEAEQLIFINKANISYGSIKKLMRDKNFLELYNMEDSLYD